MISVLLLLTLSQLYECFPQSLVATGGELLQKVVVGQVRPIEITKFHINSTIQFRYARTHVVSHVKNPGSAPNNADFTIILPDSAFISNFSMIIKEVEYVAEVKEKEEAKKTFDEAVSDGKGAGIVSKDARDANLFTVSTNIEPGEKVIFKLTYEELLERKAGRYEHAINIDPKNIVDDLKIEVYINESLPISTISVPELIQSNEIDAINNEENKVAVVTKNVDGYQNNARIVFNPSTDYQKEAGAQGISGQFLVKYDLDRKSQENEVQVIDGYFVHYFVPDDLETFPKHAIFVLDVSGSMWGEKMEQLKDAMFTILDDMTENDYIDIITFSDGTDHWKPLEESDNERQVATTLIKATEKNKNEAIKHIIGLESDGGTNINEAMLEGIKLAELAIQSENLPKEVKSMIVFLTDGLPSEGEQNGDLIKKNIKDANEKLDIPIFCIGFGMDADFNLIKDISLQSDSFSKRIYEGSDAALQLEDFYAEISSPLISNLKFEYVGGSVDNSSISNTNLKTYFKGGEYIIAGKLEDDVPEGEILSVKVVGEGKKGIYEKTFEICLNEEETPGDLTILYPDSDVVPSCYFPPLYPSRSLAEHFMQKLHAFLNIKQLIKKSDSELEKKALNLALENNFVTDLTSLLVVRPYEPPTVSILENVDLLSNQNAFSSSFAGSSSLFAAPVQYDVYDAIEEDDYLDYEDIALLSTPSTLSFPVPAFTSTTTTTATITVTTTTSNNKVPAFTSTTTTTTTTTTTKITSTTVPASVECEGELSIFTKTYLRGENLTVTDDVTDFSDFSFDDVSVSASVSGTCCWTIFAGKNFTGKGLILSSDEKYTSVSSLGDLFRDVTSARKDTCIYI